MRVCTVGIPPKMTLAQIVSDRIRNYIIDNNLKPGDKLPSEKDLTEALSVSRTVVRESLKSLQAMGMIRIKAGEGIYVDDSTLKSVHNLLDYHWKTNGIQLKELFETRKVLELGAINLAIENNEFEQLEEMDKWNQLYLEKINRNENPRAADIGFHRALFKATGNNTFYQLNEFTLEYFNTSILGSYNDREELKRSFEEHKEIIEWIKAKNVGNAQKVMLRHFEPIQKFLDRYEDLKGAEYETDREN
jgi:GntR family transcriptional regulator, transcriptional repressor for pyruvate dehydrogenase complex